MPKFGLKVGSKGFYKGMVYNIIASYDNCWALSKDCYETGTLVPKAHVQPVVTDRFNVGDKVKSKYSFVGVVTGFEHEQNRAVCVSEKIHEYSDRGEIGSGDRSRYAYLPTEIELVPEEPIFQLNKVYTISHGGRPLRVRALESTSSGERFTLYRVDDGTPYCTIPAEITASEFAKMGLHIV